MTPTAPVPKPPARQLLIMRHAKSSWSDPGMADFDRPLNKRGQSAAPAMGQRLADAQLQVDIILPVQPGACVKQCTCSSRTGITGGK